MNFLDFVQLALAAYGMSFLFLDSYILAPPRNWLARRSEFAEGLFSCHFCAGMWIGAFFACRSFAPEIYAPIINIFSIATICYALDIIFTRLERN